jgi:hypothetical protein
VPNFLGGAFFKKSDLPAGFFIKYLPLLKQARIVPESGYNINI